VGAEGQTSTSYGPARSASTGHATETKARWAAHIDHATMCTAVGEYLVFKLLALGTPGQLRTHQQEERRRAITTLEVCDALDDSERRR